MKKFLKFFIISYLAIGIVINIITGGLSNVGELESKIRDIEYDNKKEFRTNIYKYFFNKNISLLPETTRKADEVHFIFVPATARLNDKKIYEIQLLDHENLFGENVIYKFSKKLLNREAKYGDRNLTCKNSILLTLQDTPIEGTLKTVVVFSDFNYLHSFFQAQYNGLCRRRIAKANKQLYDQLSKIKLNADFILIHNLAELTPQVDLVNIENNKVYSASQYKIDIPESIKETIKKNTNTKSTKLSVLDYSAAFVLDILTYPLQWEDLVWIIACIFVYCP